MEPNCPPLEWEAELSDWPLRECGRDDCLWLLKLGHKRNCCFRVLLTLLWGKPATMPQDTQAALGDSPTGRETQASCWQPREGTISEVAPPAPVKASDNDAAPADILNAVSWEIPYQDCSAKLLQNSRSAKSMKDNDYCCFKPLSFGTTCYTSVDNLGTWVSRREVLLLPQANNRESPIYPKVHWWINE